MVTYLVPYLSMPLTNFSSSSGAQPPLTTSDAIFANHLLRQSLFVLLGTCFAIACHLDGFELSGSSVCAVSCDIDAKQTTERTLLDGLSEELVLLRCPGSTFSAEHLRHVVNEMASVGKMEEG